MFYARQKRRLQSFESNLGAKPKRRFCFELFLVRPDTECKSFRRSLNDVMGRDHQNDHECSGLQRRMGSCKEFRRFCAVGCRFIFNNSSFLNQSRAFDELVRFSGDSASAAATNNAGYYPVVAFQIQTSLDRIAIGMRYGCAGGI